MPDSSNCTTNDSCVPQAQSRCPWFPDSNWDDFDTDDDYDGMMTFTYWLCQTTLVPLGILWNSLLFFTFRSKLLQGTTFLYLRRIAFLQLFQSILSITAAYDSHILEPLSRYSFYSYILVLDKIVAPLMQSCKLAVCMLAFFMTLDRYLAVACPQRYNAMSKPRFFHLGLLVSCAISILPLEYLGEISLTDGVNSTLTTTDNWLSRNEVHMTFVVPLIMSIKLLIVLSMSLMGVGIVYSLVQRSKRIQTMTTRDQGIAEYKRMLTMARFQMADTVIMILDVGICSFTLDVSVYVKKSSTSSACSVVLSMCRVVFTNEAMAYLTLLSDILQASAHGELLFIYMCFKRFRVVFIGEGRKILAKILKIGKKNKVHGGGSYHVDNKIGAVSKQVAWMA